MGVGMPQSLLLQEFGEHVYRAFGHVCYHVGSSLKEKGGWRDVDVRLILPDDVYGRMGYGDPEHPQLNKKWVSTVLAWSTFGKVLTGLPIDFQIQQSSMANEKEKGSRSALFSLCSRERRKLIPETMVARLLCLMELEPESSEDAKKFIARVVVYLTDEELYERLRMSHGSSTPAHWWNVG